MKVLRIGTRGSALALWQARSVAAQLHRSAGVESQLVIVKTSGDKFPQKSFAEIGGKGVFIKELEDALLERRIDLAVHSMKDVPTEIPPGLTVTTIGKREDVRDALLSAAGVALRDLPRGARVGTSSLRRQAQLLHVRNDLRMAELRGNVETRIAKMKRGDYDAVVLAKAGLDRLGLAAHITEVLPASVCLPGVGQGALGVEARAADQDTLRIVSALEDPETRGGVEAERAALAALEGGCQASIGAWGRVENEKLVLDVVVLSVDGSERIAEQGVGEPPSAARLGRKVAESLLDRGAAKLLARAPGSHEPGAQSPAQAVPVKRSAS